MKKIALGLFLNTICWLIFVFLVAYFKPERMKENGQLRGELVLSLWLVWYIPTVLLVIRALLYPIRRLVERPVVRGNAIPIK